MTKVKNELKRRDGNPIPTLKNIRVNGDLRGCSGFLTDPITDRTIYLSTEQSCGPVSGFLYRTARNTKDFRGGHNRFGSTDLSVFLDEIDELFQDDRAWEREQKENAA